VISISNEVEVVGAHPTPGLNVRSNSKIKVDHCSWSRILTSAIQCKVHAGVEDPEQEWILGELIRYLEHSSSGVSTLSDMGPSWSQIRKDARQNMISKSSTDCVDIATKWSELLRHISLRLAAHIGAPVSQVLPKSQQDSKARIKYITSTLADLGMMSGVFKVPNTAGNLTVTADLRSSQILTEMKLDAPKDKKDKGSIGWLVRQLSDSPKSLVVEAYRSGSRTPISASLEEVLYDLSVLLDEERNDINKFRVTLYSPAGKSRRSTGKSIGFTDSVDNAIDIFYATIMQQISPWVPSAPKLVKKMNHDTAPQPTSDNETARQPMRRSEDAEQNKMEDLQEPIEIQDGSLDLTEPVHINH